LIQAVKDYKSGKRENAVMKAFASPLNDQDIANFGGLLFVVKMMPGRAHSR
jgi:cytochrome c553